MSQITWQVHPGKYVATLSIFGDGRPIDQITFADMPFRDEEGNVIHTLTAQAQVQEAIRRILQLASR